MPAQKVEARPHRQPHQPMFERRFPTKTRQLLVGLHPHLLDDVLHLAFTPRITTRGRENPWRVLCNQWLEAGRIAFEHGGYQLRFRGFHPAEYGKPALPRGTKVTVW